MVNSQIAQHPTLAGPAGSAGGPTSGAGSNKERIGMPSPPNRRLDFDRRVQKEMLIARELTSQRLLKGAKLRRAQAAIKAAPESFASSKPGDLSFLPRPLSVEEKG